jgi:CheY-like chemotaxis protein
MEFVGQTRILAVDDDEGSRKLVKAMLSPLGCQVFTASSGAEAIDMVGSGDWDAVLMDIGMPEMDGLTALEIIREKYPMEDLPIVMVTGMDDVESRNHALAHRANDFIVKPVEQGELMARLGNILTLRWAKREVEERLREAEAANDLMMKMMGSVVHDIKGALTCARGFIELAMEDGGTAGPAIPGGHLQKSLAAVERACGMAEEANNVSAMGRGKLKPRLEDFDIKLLLGKKVGDFRGVAAANNITLSMECAADLPVATADHALLDRVFGNLLSGAVRRAGPGGVIKASIARSGGDGLLVTVGDNGVGASRPFRQRIYDRECQEEFQGMGLDSTTGIGMSFVRMAVETMGGKMWVSSEAGSGTHFSFILPARKVMFAGPVAVKS